MARKKKKSRKQIEREEAQAREARLAFLGRLTTGLAHQIRTPLNAIRLNAQLMAEDAAKMPEELQEPIERRLKRISTEAESLAETLDTFLAFARPPRAAKVPTDLQGFLQETIDFMRPACERQQVALTLDVQEGLYPVRVDPKQLSQALLHLMENALQALRGPGRISLHAAETQNDVVIKVSDDAGGVPEDLEEKIFEEFFTTRDQGTGLGLLIARRIAAEHGGTLELENKPGVGATFVVHLPRARIIDYDAVQMRRAPGD